MTSTMHKAAPVDRDSATEFVTAWAASLDAAIEQRDTTALKDLFQSDATFRDLLVLSWDFRNAVGAPRIADLLSSSLPPRTIALRAGSTPHVKETADGSVVIHAFLEVTTEVGNGNGFVELRETSDGSWIAQACALSLSTLHARPELIGDNRPDGRVHGPRPGRPTWNHFVDKDFERTEPDVIVIGAGHNGLMLAARLRAMDVNVLVLERNERVGDNWRNRYSSLALHTPLAVDGLPYLPYPPTWPAHSPKEKYADFLESYAKLLDIPVWTGTTAGDIEFDEDTRSWSTTVTRPDGTTRSLQAPHLVFATGVNGQPSIPTFPGREDFQGSVIHAVDYRGHAEWKGKKVVVVGSGVSGHDIAQDLAEHGVDVTLVQRSGTMVLDISTYHALMFEEHLSGNHTADDADLIGASVPFGALPSRGAAQRAIAEERDRVLHEKLTKAGFTLSEGPDGNGLLGAIFGAGATGYYFNVGASELIIDGSIRLHQGGVIGFTAAGPQFDDGSTLEADLVVFATGYRGANAAVEDTLGPETAAQLGNIARVGDDGEFGKCWRNSGIDRLWFMISLGIDNGRFYSRLLALQIAADLAGIAPSATS